MKNTMPKLVVKIGGGLGNQMFQYALGRYIADKTGHEIVLDLTDFTISSLRTFQLSHFSGIKSVRRWGRIREWLFFLLWIVNRKISTKLFKRILWVLRIKWLYVYDPMKFQGDFDDVSIKNWRGLIYLSGCYGHIQHMPSRKKLHGIFEVELLRPDNLRYLKKIRASNSVSVHIRRTDYLWKSNGVPCLDVVYQKRAIDFIKTKVDDLSWFFFSDDIGWCKKEFSNLENAIFVEGNEHLPWEDIWLMSECRHHIIANSTFSWWGAYLGMSNGMTTYPDPWFRSGGGETHLPSTAVCGDWIPISSKPD